MGYDAADVLHFCRFINFDLQLFSPGGGRVQSTVSGFKKARGEQQSPSAEERQACIRLPHSTRLSPRPRVARSLMALPSRSLPSHQHPSIRLERKASTSPGAGPPSPADPLAWASAQLRAHRPSVREFPPTPAPRPTRSAPPPHPAPAEFPGVRTALLPALRPASPAPLQLRGPSCAAPPARLSSDLPSPSSE